MWLNRACVVRHIGRGAFKEECIDISARCKKQQCPEGTKCGLNLKEKIECFSESEQSENCGPESLRLEQPCPADAGIKGFGMGCTFCKAGNPFVGRNHPLTPTPIDVNSWSVRAAQSGKGSHVGPIKPTGYAGRFPIVEKVVEKLKGKW